ncbi:hypothetical protein F5148DRAFT_25613 [Russula earlei]|uniref:Uncharacterized protein n=1 Tax=Russula earlei TaxID=71964 RepID=A0ACC0TRD5_9AGAM|nr:hypothetical protein F5148DRAFT_25613 [Russula earlei]
MASVGESDNPLTKDGREDQCLRFRPLASEAAVYPKHINCALLLPLQSLTYLTTTFCSDEPHNLRDRNDVQYRVSSRRSSLVRSFHRLGLIHLPKARRSRREVTTNQLHDDGDTLSAPLHHLSLGLVHTGRRPVSEILDIWPGLPLSGSITWLIIILMVNIAAAFDSDHRDRIHLWAVAMPKAIPSTAAVVGSC